MIEHGWPPCPVARSRNRAGRGCVTGTSHGLKLVSNGGTLIRTLPVPGTSADTCNPVRWWNGGTVLASCAPPGSAVPQLWLVPVDPATRAEQWLIRAPANVTGAAIAIPFYSRQNGNL
jgi:hypothetical protein